QAQCEALRTALDRADDAYKIVLIHHPPDRALASGHRGLVDVAAVRDVLAEGCVDLVLHGHNHRASEATLATARGTAHIIGVPSASSDGVKHELAGYGLIDIDLVRKRVRLTRRAAADTDGSIQQVARLDL
ncbi:MAG: metallophosphoesterase, partial [Pseudomonadota bacterium]